MTRPTSLYRYFDDAGTLLYVGITSRMTGRSLQHAGEKSWWGEVVRCEWEHYPTREEALAREQAAIRDELPAYNVMGRRSVVGRETAAEVEHRFPDDDDLAWVEGTGRYATVAWCGGLTVALHRSLGDATRSFGFSAPTGTDPVSRQRILAAHRGSARFCGHACYGDHELVDLERPEDYHLDVERERMDRRVSHFSTCVTCRYLHPTGVHAAIERGSIRMLRARKHEVRRNPPPWMVDVDDDVIEHPS